MLVTTLIMAAIAAVLFFIAYRKGHGAHVDGLLAAWKTTLQVLPMLIFAFIIAGMISVLVPGELLKRWVGQESGLRGIVIGTVAGGFAPGGPYVSLPIAATLYNSGAGLGSMVAFLTGWSLWAVSRLPMELGFMGWRFTLVRLACTFFFPPIAGFIAHRLFESAR